MTFVHSIGSWTTLEGFGLSFQGVGVVYEFHCVKVRGFWRHSICWHIKLAPPQLQPEQSVLRQRSSPTSCGRLCAAAADPSLTAAPPRFYLCVCEAADMFFFFPLTGRVHLYANEIPVTFKAGCLNSGRGRATTVFCFFGCRRRKSARKKDLSLAQPSHIHANFFTSLSSW